ncbi:hypothetical protein F5B19DRAFT_468769, partial [Rostrohypoxylon terebratum]
MSEPAVTETNNQTKPPDEAEPTKDKAEASEEAPDETDYEAAYAEQFEEEEQDHWDDSYGDDVEEPPSRGGKHTGTIKNITPKPPPKNNPA